MHVPVDKIVPLTTARDTLSKIIADVESGTPLYILTKNGKPSVAVMSVDQLQKQTGPIEMDKPQNPAPMPPGPPTPAATPVSPEPAPVPPAPEPQPPMPPESTPTSMPPMPEPPAPTPPAPPPAPTSPAPSGAATVRVDGAAETSFWGQPQPSVDAIRHSDPNNAPSPAQFTGTPAAGGPAKSSDPDDMIID